MAIYVVLSDGPSDKLKANIETHFPGDQHFNVATHQWLIETDAVDSTISSLLELPEGKAGVRAVIFRVANRGVGWHARTMWEWIAVKDKA